MYPTPEVLRFYEDGDPRRVPLVLEVAGPQETTTAEHLRWEWKYGEAAWPLRDARLLSWDSIWVLPA